MEKARKSAKEQALVRDHHCNTYTYDNGQKVESKNNQRFGQSSTMPMVTIWLLLKNWDLPPSQIYEHNAFRKLTREQITYLFNVIPSPVGMEVYEELVGSLSN